MMAVRWRLTDQFRASRVISALWPMRNSAHGQALPIIGRLGALSRVAGRVCCGTSDAAFGGNHSPEGMAQGGHQELLWRDFFSDPSQWWDNRRGKVTPQHPDFRHKKSRKALWLSHWHKPSWVERQLKVWEAYVNAGTRMPATSVQGAPGRSAAYEGGVQLGTCRKLCEDGKVSEAVDALLLLVQQLRPIPINLLYHVLMRSIAQKDLVLGSRIHALTVESGHEGHSFLATHLIGMYASHGRLKEAMRVFHKVCTPDVYNWASIILAYARHGEPTQAIDFYQQMRDSTVMPNNRIFGAVLQACARAGDLAAGKDVHAHILASGDLPDIFVQNCLVDMYAKCGSLEDAQRVFDRLSEKNVVTWNAIMAGYAQQGMDHEALSLYSAMQQGGITSPDSVTFVCLLQACASAGLATLHQLHAQIEKRGLQDNGNVGNSLVSTYAKCGSLEDAHKVFDRLPHKDVVTWTAMIAGYAQEGLCQQVFSLYSSMREQCITAPNSVTYVCLLQTCGHVGVAALDQGKQLHAHIEEQGLQDDVVVGGSLINMYAQCGSLENAQRIFDRLPQKNVVTWTAMIAAYSHQGLCQEALAVYSSMQQEGITPPNSVTFVCLLQACASVGVVAGHQGKQLHALIEERGLQDDVVVGASLVNMYVKCFSVQHAHRVFDRLLHKNVVTWNAMIAGYAQQGMCSEALGLYSTMEQAGTTLADSVTFVCLLQACAVVAALPLGKQLHSQIEERGLQADGVVGSSLVNMYSRCGSMVDSQQVFDSLPEKDIVAWNALIAGYSRQGDSETVFNLVHRMRQDDIQPDDITILTVLTVCSHVGLVDKGREYFEALIANYGITPTLEHYTCMLDLLGRAGHLHEALAMAKAMPFQPDSTVWLTLLGACQKWGNTAVGQQAFECAVTLNQKDSSPYVLMSNIYASAEMWEEAKEMQERRVRSGACKDPGQSWCTDVGGVVHGFVVGDENHSEGEGILHTTV